MENEIALTTVISKLDRDTREAAKTLTPRGVRYLVDSYYQQQENRKRADNQTRSMEEDGEPVTVFRYLSDEAATLERRVWSLLDIYSVTTHTGRWARSIIGIGPVIAAGLMAHIDIAKAPTPSHIFSFAGLNPSAVWGKGEKRPHNARLKVLCFHAGQSFVKQTTSFYRPHYDARKAYEVERNESMGNEDAAKAKLDKFKIGKDTEAYGWYSQGKLPPAHLDARARRWVVKLFLSHWHEVASHDLYGKYNIKPYAIAHLDHAEYIAPPVFTE